MNKPSMDDIQKPHLYQVNGKWHCSGSGWYGRGESPAYAYALWRIYAGLEDSARNDRKR